MLNSKRATSPRQMDRWSLGAAWGLWIGLATALLVRLPLLSTRYVPFNSDEAVVGLMAKHILDGSPPTFFYGQAYMGSLDAWLIAGSFLAMGERVLAIRLVQLLLYLAFLAGLWGMVLRFYRDRALANWAALLAAVPPLVVTTYTTATLGGYGEILLLEIVVLTLGYHTLEAKRPALVAWAALGVAAGVAFWTLGLSGVYLAPVAILHGVRFQRRRLSGYLLGAAGFLVGSSPWWTYNWRHGGAALRVLTSGTPMETSVLQRSLGLATLGSSAALGLRAPWSSSFVSLPLLFLGVVLWLSVLASLLSAWRNRTKGLSSGTWLLLGLSATFVVTFVGTQFGIDATGRYLLPVYPVLVVAAAHLLRAAADWRRWAGPALLAGFWLVNGISSWQAAQSSARITTQFDPITRFGNAYDQALIARLDDLGVDRGYSNHWVAYRLAFLTDERILLAAELPYKADLRYTERDQRLPAYGREADRSNDVVYVTTQHPALDARLRSEFERLGVEFRETGIGPYHLFYRLSKPLRPEQLRLTAEAGGP